VIAAGGEDKNKEAEQEEGEKALNTEAENH